MKLSDRLQACANLVIPGNVAVDVGTDHGFLPIYLLKNGICPRVLAADLREKPLETARKNAAAAGMENKLEFYLSDGLSQVPMEGVDTVICAGMGGDLIAQILLAAKDCWVPKRQFILQPQSAVSDLREFLSKQGFSILSEHFVEDAGFIYTVMNVRWVGAQAPRLTVGQCFLPQGDYPRQGPDYVRYMRRARNNIEKTVMGLRRARQQDPGKLARYEAGLAALREVEDSYENSQ